MTAKQKQIQTDIKIQRIEEEQKTVKKPRFKLSWKLFNNLIICLIIISGISYILCVNDLAIQGFKLNELKKEQQLIENDSKQNDLEIMALKSYNNLSQRAKSLSMVPVSRSFYIQSDTVLVVNK